MADINELLDKLRNPGEDGIPDTIYDDIAGTYNHAVETRDAKISETEKALQEREAEISALKSANYDLMMSTAVEKDEGGDESETEPEDSPSGIDDLFD